MDGQIEAQRNVGAVGSHGKIMPVTSWRNQKPSAVISQHCFTYGVGGSAYFLRVGRAHWADLGGIAGLAGLMR